MCFPGAETIMATIMSAASTAATAAGPTLSTVGSALANPMTQAALMAAGTGANLYGQKQAQNATNRAASAEQRRQRDFRQNQQVVTDGMLDTSRRNVREEDLMRRMGTIKRENRQVLADRTPGTRSVFPGSGSASRAVSSSSARSAQASGRGTAGIADAIARSGAFRGMMGGYNRELQEVFGKMQTENSLARGSASVLPLELQAAQQRGSTARGIGNMLQAAATLSALTSGFSGMFGGNGLPTDLSDGMELMPGYGTL